MCPHNACQSLQVRQSTTALQQQQRPDSEVQDLASLQYTSSELHQRLKAVAKAAESVRPRLAGCFPGACSSAQRPELPQVSAGPAADALVEELRHTVTGLQIHRQRLCLALKALDICQLDQEDAADWLQPIERLTCQQLLLLALKTSHSSQATQAWPMPRLQSRRSTVSC